MIEPENDIWQIISNVQDGKASPEEVEIFENWLCKKENKQFYNILTHIKPLKETNNQEVKLRVFNKIRTAMLPKQFTRKLNIWRYTAVASVAALFITGILFFKVQSKQSLIEAQTPKGIKSKILLSDGSVVFLNSGSLLRYPTEFARKQRIVELEGEAYFEIKKKTDQPFIVQTDRIKIKVLGTHFNVKSFKEDDLIETSLLEGSVAIYSKSDNEMKDGIKLIPDQQAVFNKRNGKVKIIKVNASQSIYWKEGKYYFENETLSSIIKTLERNYNIPIRITSPELGNQKYVGLFTNSINIYRMLDVMKIHNNFYYKIKNDTIYISKN